MGKRKGRSLTEEVWTENLMLKQLEEEAAAEKEQGQALKQRQEAPSSALITVLSCTVERRWREG